MTTPTEQTLDECWLAVSKSIAIKSLIIIIPVRILTLVNDVKWCKN